jgi:hypothetical protein
MLVNLNELKGRARSAENALRHGLNRVSRRHPLYQEDIYTIAKMMCADDGNPELFEAAVRVAECDVLIREARLYRHRMVLRLLDAYSLPLGAANEERKNRVEMFDKKIEAGAKLVKIAPGKSSAPEERTEFNALAKEYFFWPKDRRPEEALTLAVPELIRISRYERRAWSRRKRALLAFMAILGGYNIVNPISNPRIIAVPKRQRGSASGVSLA